MQHSCIMFMEQSPLFRNQYSLTKYTAPVPLMEHEERAIASCPKPEEYSPHLYTQKTVYNLVFLIGYDKVILKTEWNLASAESRVTKVRRERTLDSLLTLPNI